MRVLPATTYALAAVALLAAGWSALLVAGDRRIGDPLVWLVAALELALVAQLVAGAVALARTDRTVDGATLVGYLLTAALVPPLGVAWAASERSRWGPGVLLVCCVALAALLARALAVWQS